jgi:hypothetical protein
VYPKQQAIVDFYWPLAKVRAYYILSSNNPIYPEEVRKPRRHSKAVFMIYPRVKYKLDRFDNISNWIYDISFKCANVESWLEEIVLIPSFGCRFVVTSTNLGIGAHL